MLNCPDLVLQEFRLVTQNLPAPSKTFGVTEPTNPEIPAPHRLPHSQNHFTAGNGVSALGGIEPRSAVGCHTNYPILSYPDVLRRCETTCAGRGADEQQRNYMRWMGANHITSAAPNHGQWQRQMLHLFPKFVRSLPIGHQRFVG